MSYRCAESTWKCLPAVIDVLAVEQRGDDVDGLAQHLVPFADRRPALADDVLVEVLPRSQPEPEATAREDLHRRRLLRDDRRVVAQDRARHVRHQADPLGRLRSGAEDRPGVARMALLLEPREVVVADHGEVEAGGLGALQVGDERVRARLLGHHRVAEVGHGLRLSPRRRSQTRSRIHQRASWLSPEA